MTRQTLTLCLPALAVGFATHASAETVFQAALNADQVVSNPTTTSATGFATFVLNDAGDALSYSVQLNGLDLDPVQADRVDPNDVTKIHLHNAPAGAAGPHVLNIFGLPSEDDDDLSVDFDAESFTGVWDDSDAIDPATGELFDQSVGSTTKPLSNFIDALLAEEIYLAVHTVEVDGEVAIRGQLRQVAAIPTPTAALAGLPLLGALALRRRR